jgi:uncharacterized protein (TIGR00296 family)
MKEGTMVLSSEDKEFLLILVRRAAVAYVEEGLKDVAIEEERITDSLKGHSGVLVALYREGLLRGCMGMVLSVLPLWQACVECARSAVVKDVRFGPLLRHELCAITFEVTVIGPKKVVKDMEEVRPGIEGLILRKDFRVEAFSPRVVSDLIRDGQPVFDHLKDRAGIDPHDDSPEVWEAFEAEVFSERTEKTLEASRAGGSVRDGYNPST